MINKMNLFDHILSGVLFGGVSVDIEYYTN